MTQAERSCYVLMTPQPNCPACRSLSRHTEADWKHHPLAGHGYSPEIGWTHPDLPSALQSTNQMPTGAAKP